MRPVSQHDADCGKLIDMYPSIAAASKKMYGKPRNNAVSIGACLKGDQKTACGFAWRPCKKEDVEAFSLGGMEE